MRESYKFKGHKFISLLGHTTINGVSLSANSSHVSASEKFKKLKSKKCHFNADYNDWIVSTVSIVGLYWIETDRTL